MRIKYAELNGEFQSEKELEQKKKRARVRETEQEKREQSCLNLFVL